MTHERHPAVGRAGAVVPPLVRGANSPQLYPAGPFGAVLGPALWVRQAAAMPDILYAVLLEKIPDSDGMNGQLHGVPLDQPIELMIRDQHHLAVAQPLLFNTKHGAQVHGLGLVDSDGRLGFAGGLRGRSLSSSPMEAFVFPSHQVLLKRLVTR